MRRVIPFALALVVGLSLCGAPSFTVMLPMRDGVRLATDVYLPEGPGPFPVLLYRTPYNKNTDNPGGRARRGYAVVAQDTRGRFSSEGKDQVFLTDGWCEPQDGYETVLWILGQPWCNGSIGTLGTSARGITQYMLAGAAPPGLVCQYIGFAAADLYSEAIYQGGAFRESLVVGWLQGQGSTYFLEEIFEHPYCDAFWSCGDLENRYEVVRAAAVHLGGWYDIFLRGAVKSFVGLQHRGGPGARGKQKLLIGPWAHGGVGEIIYPPNSMQPPVVYADSDAWFDYHLRGEPNGLESDPPVCYYLMGAVGEPNAPGNEWRLAEDWPVTSKPLVFYLRQGGLLSTEAPQEEDAWSTYVFDPDNPVPTRGGANLNLPMGPYDQRPVEQRPDVLLFTTPPLQEPVVVTGRVLVRLFVASDGPDTDFTAKLCDVYPDGRSMLVCDGIIRMRYRNGCKSEELMEPGRVYSCLIDLWETALVFNRGHRIRLAVSSSNYPRFSVNGNTAEPPGPGQPRRKARNTVFFDAARPSQVIFRVPVTGFVRGDGNGDGTVDLADAVYMLAYLFAGGPQPACADAGDANDDGILDLSDPISVLAFLFAGGTLPDPGLECGEDPTRDLLSCVSYVACPVRL